MGGLAELLRAVLKVDPAANAIEFDRQWWSWGDLDRIIDDVNAHLVAAGLAEGVRVGGFLRNRPQVAALLVGVVSGGRCMVTLNPMLPDDRLAEDVRVLRPPVLIGLEEDWRREPLRHAAMEIGAMALVLPARAGDPVYVLEGCSTPLGSDLRIVAPSIAVEMLTSGTTGKPKRVPLPARTLERAVLDAGVYDNRKPDDPAQLREGVQILNAPFAHIGGVFGLFNCMAAGRSSCLMDKFSVAEWADAVRRFRPKVAGAPPAALRMILDADVAKDDLSSLVAFRTGTAPLDPDLGDAFFERFGIPVLQNYGATEFAGGVAGWTLRDFYRHHKDKRGAVGRMNPGCEARIVNPDTGAVLPFGDEGLLELRASHLGDGAWMRTTDLAVLDADDFLWINGRYDNAIIRGGFKIFPDDVVRAMEQHPAVREAAIVGLADPRLGQVPAAAFIPKSGATVPPMGELTQFLKERLLPYQVPVRILVLDELPRTPSLKVSQPELRKLFADHAA